VLSDSIDRDAEPPSVDQVGALRELAACVNQRGFEPDIGSPMASVLVLVPVVIITGPNR
jgi:hypothetical protein